MSIPTQIGLEAKARQGLVALLEVILADNAVLAMLSRNAHWNVTGPHFSELHALFGKHYDQLSDAGDDIAERIRALGHSAPGSLSEFLARTTLTELSGEERSGQFFLEALLRGHESICVQLRKAIKAADETFNDPATSDFLTGLLESHEKTAWMLRAHLTHN